MWLGTALSAHPLATLPLTIKAVALPARVHNHHSARTKLLTIYQGMGCSAVLTQIMVNNVMDLDTSA